MKNVIKIILSTIGVIILLFVLIGIVGISSFNSTVTKEKETLFGSDINYRKKILEKDLDEFPYLVKNYLVKTGVIGKPKYCNIVFKQEGKIKTQSDKHWLSFTATQYMSSHNAGFIWKAKALPIYIKDKYVNNIGEVKVSFLGLKDVGKFSGKEVDQGSLGRYFGELIWFPIGFLDSDISWEPIDSKSIKAIIKKGKLSLEGVFFFDQNGMIDRFETKRYKNKTLEKFIGKVGVYKNYDGLLLPDSMTAIWDLKEGNFEYFKAAITDYKISTDM